MIPTNTLNCVIVCKVPTLLQHSHVFSHSTASQPKEPELRYHVAAKLGQDWRKVCTYLELQHYQLEQADVARSQLEDKAMEALVMWLRGQGNPKAPRSWKTLLRALRLAGHNDMASDIERDIKNGTLSVPTA